MKLKTALEGIGQGGHQEMCARHNSGTKSCLIEGRAPWSWGWGWNLEADLLSPLAETPMVLFLPLPPQWHMRPVQCPGGKIGAKAQEPRRFQIQLYHQQAV